jgi:hypothetical protein
MYLETVKQQPTIMNNKGIHVYVMNKPKFDKNGDPPRNRRCIGVLAATAHRSLENEVFIGWSLCNKTLGDKFSPTMGKTIAYARSFEGSIEPIPASLLPQYEIFISRCNDYFKNKNVIC